MQANELKAVLGRTDEFAIAPYHVEAELPWNYKQRNRQGRTLCPRGLTRAKIIENGVQWVEKRPVAACGDRDYEITRRNGVLIEFKFDSKLHAGTSITKGELRYKKTKNSKIIRVPHTEVVERDGESFVRMIISRKAVLAAWDEYTLIEAQRDQEDKQYSEIRERGENALRGLLGEDYDALRRYSSTRYRPDGYVLDADGQTVRDKKNEKTKRRMEHNITIPIEVAEKIIEKLAPQENETVLIKRVS